MSCTRRKHLLMEKKDSKVILLDFPIFTLPFETMKLKNHAKALQLEGQEVKSYLSLEQLEDLRDLEKPQGHYKDWLNGWRSLLVDPSGIEDFQKLLGGFDPAESLRSAKVILDLLTLLSDKPELFDKKLFNKVTKESGLDEADDISEYREFIKPIFEQIDNLGFNTMSLFNIDDWNYIDMIIQMGTDYIIKHQYYPICQQIVINNS